jgi:hypothetical protein
MTIEVEIAGTGQIAEFPDGTPPEVIQQALSGVNQAQQDQGNAAVDAEIAKRLQDVDPVEQTQVTRGRGGRGIGGRQSQQILNQARAQLREVNPLLADQIEEMGGFETFLVGFGKGIGDVGRGIGLLDQESPEDKASFQALKSTTRTAGAGELVGQAAPFVAPSLGVANIASLPARLAASGAIGASEGGILSAGQGRSGEDIVKSAGIGLILGVGGETLLPVVNSVGRKVLKKFGSKANVLTPDGVPTPEIQDALAAKGATFDDLVDAAKELDAGGDIVGNARREAVFEKMGMTPTEAQRTRDIDLFIAQQDAFKKSGKVRNALDLQETQLTEQTSKVISDIGASADPSSAIDVITDRSIKLDDEINQLYTQARDAAQGGANVKLTSGIESLRTNAPLNARSEGTVKAIKDQMEVMGIADGFKPTGRINVEQAENLRQFANGLVDGANPQAKKVIREFKDGLDDDVFRSAGEDVFKSARAAKRDFEKGLTKEAKNKFDRNRTSLVRDMLDNTLAPEDVGKIVRAGSKYKAADLVDLKRYLSSGSPEDIAKGMASWNDIRGHAMETIRESAFTGPIRTDGSKSLSRAGIQKAFKAIGNDKAKVLFSADERDFLMNLAEVAALKEPPPGTFTGTGPSGQAIKRAADRIIENSGVPGASFAKDVLSDFGGRRVTRAQEKRVLTLVDDAAKIQKQNAERAFEVLRKSQLGGAVGTLPALAIPATQTEDR